jgi:serine protease inhibitor
MTMKTRTKAVFACCFALVIVGLIVGLFVREASYRLDPRLVKADNDFAFKLFREVMRKQGNKNVFISPASISLALHMTYNGASCKTREAMAGSLGLEGLSLDEINRANAKLTQLLATPDSGVQLGIANSLWGRRGLSFKPKFIRRARRFYDAEVSSLDFATPVASREINSWVARRTSGRITGIAQPLAPDEALVLVNAIYFRGQWARQFDASLTQDSPFYLPNGWHKMVPMMYEKGAFMRSEGDGLEMIRLPYRGGRMSMEIVLPEHDPSGSGTRLNLANWNRWVSRMRKVDDVRVYLPRFTVRDSTDLREMLARLGMGIAFDPVNADFTGMCSEPGWIAAIDHEALIELNETGVTATATTTERFADSHMFLADHPFFFVIRDDKTGLILFMGQIVDPAPDRPALGRHR